MRFSDRLARSGTGDPASCGESTQSIRPKPGATALHDLDLDSSVSVHFGVLSLLRGRLARLTVGGLARRTRNGVRCIRHGHPSCQIKR